MNDLSRWLSPLAVFAFMAAFLYWIRRIVRRQAVKISAQLDAYDYVVIEAHPAQLSGLKADYEANGWRLAESKRRDAIAMLYRFEATDDRSSKLSKILGIGRKPSRIPANYGDVKFPMKIKAHGLKSELNA